MQPRTTRCTSAAAIMLMLGACALPGPKVAPLPAAPTSSPPSVEDLAAAQLAVLTARRLGLGTDVEL